MISRVRRLVDVLDELLDIDFVISVVPLSDHKGLAKKNSRMPVFIRFPYAILSNCAQNNLRAPEKHQF